VVILIYNRVSLLFKAKDSEAVWKKS
jgi:hypothetical protein